MDDPVPAVQDVTLSNVVGGTFTLRVMGNALGGEIDAETAEIGYSASATAVELALEATSGTLGDVQVTKTTSGKTTHHVSLSSMMIALHSFHTARVPPQPFGNTLYKHRRLMTRQMPLLTNVFKEAPCLSHLVCWTMLT